jgi:hypothetical protein
MTILTDPIALINIKKAIDKMVILVIAYFYDCLGKECGACSVENYIKSSKSSKLS